MHTLLGLFAYIGEPECKNGGFRSKITKSEKGRYVSNATIFINFKTWCRFN